MPEIREVYYFKKGIFIMFSEIYDNKLYYAF